MSLTHLSGSDDHEIHVPRTRTLRPVNPRIEPETFSPVLATGDLRPLDDEKPRVDIFAADPKVKKAQAKLDQMIAAQAGPAVIQRWQRKVNEAKTDLLERHAVARSTARAKAIDESKTQARAKIEREHLHRMDGWAQCAIKIGRVVITTKIDRNMEAGHRLVALNDIRTVALQIASREGERMAAIAKQGGIPTQDTARVIAEIRDRMRRSILSGETEISELPA